jgi:hypothetical protein
MRSNEEGESSGKRSHGDEKASEAGCLERNSIDQGKIAVNRFDEKGGASAPLLFTRVYRYMAFL